MRLLVAADEMRRARTHAPTRRALARRGDDRRVAGEAEIIVAREREHATPVDDDARPLRGFERAPDAIQARFAPCRELALESLDQRGRHGAYASQALDRPSFANSAWSAATSGLPVVSSRSP